MDTSRQNVGASKEVFLDMKGACFLCLKGPFNEVEISTIGGGGRVSLRDICHYLEVTELEVDGFSNNLDEGDSSGQREQLGFAVSLCEVCNSEVNQLVGFIHELEEIQKRITRQLQQVHVILERSLGNDQSNQPWKKNLLTASLVGFLRKEAGEKCLEKIRNLGVIPDPVPDVPASTQKSPIASSQLNEGSSSILAKKNHQDVPNSAPMEPAANPDSISPEIATIVGHVPELWIPLQKSSINLNDVSSINSVETNHLNFPSRATTEPVPNPASIPSANCRPQKKRRNIVIISADEDIPVSRQESSTSSQFDTTSSSNSVEIIDQGQDLSDNAEMEPVTVSRSSSSSANCDPPRDASSQDQRTTWACQLEDGGCGKVFSRKAKLTNHQNNCPKLNLNEEQPEMEEMDEDSDDSEFWSADSPQSNDEDEEYQHPDDDLVEESPTQNVLKIFDKNFRTSRGYRPTHECLHCDSASGRDRYLCNMRKHVSIYHPEVLFQSSKLPRLSKNNFRTCVKELLRRETVAGKEEAKKRGEIPKDEYRESPHYCVPCQLTIPVGTVYRFHRLTEHYGSLRRKLISLQEDFSKGKFSKLKRLVTSVPKGQKRKVAVDGGGGKKYMAARGKTFPCAVEEGGCGKIFNVERNLKRHKKQGCRRKKIGRAVEGDGDGASGSSLDGGDVEGEVGENSSSMDDNQMEDSGTDDDDDMFECE